MMTRIPFVLHLVASASVLVPGLALSEGNSPATPDAQGVPETTQGKETSNGTPADAPVDAPAPADAPAPVAAKRPRVKGLPSVAVYAQKGCAVEAYISDRRSPAVGRLVGFQDATDVLVTAGRIVFVGERFRPTDKRRAALGDTSNVVLPPNLRATWLRPVRIQLGSSSSGKCATLEPSMVGKLVAEVPARLRPEVLPSLVTLDMGVGFVNTWWDVREKSAARGPAYALDLVWMAPRSSAWTLGLGARGTWETLSVEAGQSPSPNAPSVAGAFTQGVVELGLHAGRYLDTRHRLHWDTTFGMGKGFSGGYSPKDDIASHTARTMRRYVIRTGLSSPIAGLLSGGLSAAYQRDDVRLSRSGASLDFESHGLAVFAHLGLRL
jgi:hypothetical protein